MLNWSIVDVKNHYLKQKIHHDHLNFLPNILKKVEQMVVEVDDDDDDDESFD